MSLSIDQPSILANRQTTHGALLIVLTFVMTVLCLPQDSLCLAQNSIPTRRFSDSASDVLELERPTTDEQVPPNTTPEDDDEDRARSLAIFGQARLLYQRGEAVQALTAYQRAYHWHPNSVAAANEIIPLAFYLERPAEATRYALIAAEQGNSDTLLMRQVAVHLVQEDKYQRAAKIYQRVLKSLESQPRSNEWVVAHFELGRLRFIMEEFAQSADSFATVTDAIEAPHKFDLTDEQVDEILGTKHLTYGLFGEAFLKANRLDRAERTFRKADELKPNKPLFAFHQARLSDKKDRTEQALQYLTEYISSGSEDAGAEPYELLQKLLPELGNKTDNWRTRLEATQKTHPNSVLTSFLAEYFEQSGNSKLALKHFQQLNATQFSAYAAQGILRTSAVQQDTTAALIMLGQHVEQTASIELVDFNKLPPNPDKGAQDNQFALKIIQSARDTCLPPKSLADAQKLFAAGLLGIQIKEFELGDELTSKAMEFIPAKARGEWQFSAALETFMADNAEQAAARFEQLADSGNAQDLSTVEFYLATALELADQTEAANKVIDRAISRSPDAALFHSRKAWIAYHAKQNDTAEQHYESFLKTFGNDFSNDALRDLVKEAKTAMSNLRLLRKDVDGAIEWLQEVLNEYPEDVGAMNDLGYVFADENRHLQRALRMAQFAVENEPENKAYLDSLGWALFRLERYDEAERHLKRAITTDEPDGIILEHLGDVYDKLDRPTDAKSTWQRAATALAEARSTERLAIVEKKIAGEKE